MSAENPPNVEFTELQGRDLKTPEQVVVYLGEAFALPALKEFVEGEGRFICFDYFLRILVELRDQMEEMSAEVEFPDSYLVPSLAERNVQTLIDIFAGPPGTQRAAIHDEPVVNTQWVTALFGDLSLQEVAAVIKTHISGKFTDGTDVRIMRALIRAGIEELTKITVDLDTGELLLNDVPFLIDDEERFLEWQLLVISKLLEEPWTINALREAVNDPNNLQVIGIGDEQISRFIYSLSEWLSITARIEWSTIDGDQAVQIVLPESVQDASEDAAV